MLERLLGDGNDDATVCDKVLIRCTGGTKTPLVIVCLCGADAVHVDLRAGVRVHVRRQIDAIADFALDALKVAAALQQKPCVIKMPPFTSCNYCGVP